MPNQLARRTLLQALVAAVPSAALAQVAGAPLPRLVDQSAEGQDQGQEAAF